MSKKILGYDIGSNSIGRALIDEENKKIIDSGSRIFPAGVSDLGTSKGKLNKNEIYEFIGNNTELINTFRAN